MFVSAETAALAQRVAESYNRVELRQTDRMRRSKVGGMQQVTRNFLGIGVGLLVALLVVNATIGYRRTNELYDQSQQVIHTLNVENALAQLMQHVTDAETGQRGYLLTGQPRYLAPYKIALANYEPWVDEISKLVSDNPRQLARAAELKKLARAKMAELAENLATHDRPEQGPQVALEMVKTDEGQQTMEKFRALVAEIGQDEKDLLDQRQTANDRAFGWARWAVWLSALVGVAALVGFLSLLNRHFYSISHSASALFEQKELLRATLASIGDGVIVTDATGRVTFLNSVAENLTGWRAGEAVGKPLEKCFQHRQRGNAEVRSIILRYAALREGRIMGLANHTILISQRWHGVADRR